MKKYYILKSVWIYLTYLILLPHLNQAQTPLYDYYLQASECILLDDYTTIIGQFPSGMNAAAATGNTNMDIQGAFAMYIDNSTAGSNHKFSYIPSGDTLFFQPGPGGNSSYKFASFLVDWMTLAGNAGSIRVDFSDGREFIMQGSDAILLDNLTQFLILGEFQSDHSYRVEISGSPQMPMQGIFVMYVDKGGTKFGYYDIGESFLFTPGVGDYKFCAFQVDWSFLGDNFGVTNIKIYEEELIPVELTSLTAKVNNSGEVVLNWATATETNNQMFEIERRIEDRQFVTLGYVEGHGTTTGIQNYQYIDNISDIQATSLSYRLKQIDYDGSYEFSEVVEVTNLAPTDFALHQNYPNPFNPVTTISYSLPVKSQVELVIYNALGESVTQLVNEEKEAGTYKVEFSATGGATALPSGIYFYRIQAGSFVQTKKMLLMK
ncbi:MAG: T9SS type A sorting domain-containing protein [Bacteroidetes bacterium]|nr:T9SS type A sorting domain-containing protein [Bacteroidota bacterium]